MDEPSKKFFGEQVPPLFFWILLALFCLSLSVSGHVLVVGTFGGLALGVYIVWVRKHGSGRHVSYPDEVRKNARWPR